MVAADALSDEMPIFIAVVPVGGRDRQAGGERVDKHIDLLSGVLCEFAVNGGTVVIECLPLKKVDS